jgi:hypothetical protein
LLLDHLLLREFGSYMMIFMNVCVVIIVAMVMLLRDFGPYAFCTLVGDNFLAKTFWPLRHDVYEYVLL